MAWAEEVHDEQVWVEQLAQGGVDQNVRICALEVELQTARVAIIERDQ